MVLKRVGFAKSWLCRGDHKVYPCEWININAIIVGEGCFFSLSFSLLLVH